MSHRLLLLVAISVPGLSGAVAYTFGGQNQTHVINFTSCTVGFCANFTTSMNVQGSFTTSVSLPANLTSQDVGAQVASYSFTDGLDTYASTDPNARIYSFNLSTDGSGHITAFVIGFEVWTSGTSPHNPSDRFNLVTLSSNQGGNDTVVHNLPCSLIETTIGVSDVCTRFQLDAASSSAAEIGLPFGIQGPVAPGTPPTSVPVLSGWAMLFLAGTLPWIAWMAMRRSRLHM